MAVADGHAGADSSALAVQLLEGDPELPGILGLRAGEALPALHAHMLDLFQAADTSWLAGDAAVLLAARRDRFVYWLSIGDCMLYVLNRELATSPGRSMRQRCTGRW